MVLSYRGGARYRDQILHISIVKVLPLCMGVKLGSGWEREMVVFIVQLQSRGCHGA